jgi:hypothetical protein
MNALNTVIANAIEKSKLGEAGFVEHGIFSSPSLVEKVCSDDILSPLCDVPMPVTYVSDHDWKSTLLLILKIFLVPILRLIIVVPLVLSMFLLMMICLKSMLCEIVALSLMMILNL